MYRNMASGSPNDSPKLEDSNERQKIDEEVFLKQTYFAPPIAKAP